VPARPYERSKKGEEVTRSEVEKVEMISGARREDEQGATCAQSEPTIKASHGDILMLTLGGLHDKHAVQRRIWVPTQSAFAL
jgi:hypothetical protein